MLLSAGFQLPASSNSGDSVWSQSRICQFHLRGGCGVTRKETRGLGNVARWELGAEISQQIGDKQPRPQFAVYSAIMHLTSMMAIV
jgi:hypothetical protein